MSEQIEKQNGDAEKRELPVLSKEWREFPSRERQPALVEKDDNGDVIFRFKIDISRRPDELTLEEFYRASVRDLLKIVRFYSKGVPVIVDAFAFLNNPHEQVQILEQPEQPE
jgi:hypothetical protein